jgi:hypothetical protein
LNERFFSRRPVVLLRVWGDCAHPCGLSFTARLTNVHHFSADCLLQATGVETSRGWGSSRHWESEYIHSRDLAFLGEIPAGFGMLFRGATRSRKPDLSVLSRFASLIDSYLERQQKNIALLSDLRGLREVTLRSISTPDSAFLTPLVQMQSLDIKQGGIRDLSAIASMANIRCPKLWQIRGLSDIEVISSLTGLQNPFLQPLAQVKRIPALTRLGHLRRISLDSLRGLTDCEELVCAPGLGKLVFGNTRNLCLEGFTPLLRSKSLRRASVWFASDMKIAQISRLRFA